MTTTQNLSGFIGPWASISQIYAVNPTWFTGRFVLADVIDGRKIITRNQENGRYSTWDVADDAAITARSEADAFPTSDSARYSLGRQDLWHRRGRIDGTPFIPLRVEATIRPYYGHDIP